MKSSWSDEEARALTARLADLPPERCNEDIALRVYTSRLIGQQSSLVLHGGGNTSVKTRLPDALGRPVDVLCVKGSGWDLGAIEPPGLPAVKLEPLRELRALDALSDEDMVNAARINLLDSSAPNPSVETLLHAFLPHKFIDHSHADAILMLADQANAETLCREVFEGTLAFVPYVMPGFDLAKLAAETHEANPNVEGLLLAQHGLFTYGDTARESYERHIKAVTRAEDYVAAKRGKVELTERDPAVDLERFAPTLRGRIGAEGRRYVLCARTSPAIRDFVDDPALRDLALRGTATPDHVIRTKQMPLIVDLAGADTSQAIAARIEPEVETYRNRYRAYFQAQVQAKGVEKTALDPDPRVILVPGFGLLAAGATPKAAAIAADIYEHTVDVIRGAEAVDRYNVLPDGDLFDMEYWSLEQAKLGKKKPRPLEGRVVIVTGAAKGIGAATARCFADAGACLHLLDLDKEALEETTAALGCVGSVVDVTDRAAVRGAVQTVVRRFGGVDGIVSNAGIAPQSPIHACPEGLLEKSFAVNFYGHHYLAEAATEVMRDQGTGGFLLFNASKAAFNPGAGFGPYAVPKAALVALMKQYALDNGGAGIRSNAINADRIRTDLLPRDMVESRARARGLEPDEYFRSNLLKREVTAHDVGQAFVSLALAEATTGQVVTVDGGNIAASPR